MKMVKSLLLVSAAGVVAAPGAQAADLPVKAKPVEYVKICSLYGAGFYYIPGTDICMKIGGYVRFQVSWNPGNSISGGPFNGIGGRGTRTDSQDYAHRTRAHSTFDTRQQTPYGTLRTYLLMGFSQDSTVAPTTSPTVYMTRAFMQIAGFTFGKATSFFDFVSTAAVSYNAGMLHTPDTGDAGQMVAAYTAQLGNGLSATISAEQTRRGATTYSGAGMFSSTWVLGVLPSANNLSGIPTTSAGAGSAQGVGQMDFVGNIRIDQAWGSAQVSAAAHNVSAGYYYQGNVASQINELNGHPGEKWGWAGSVGLRINTPQVAAGNYFQGAFHYCEGAIKYCAGATPTGNGYLRFQGNTLGFGFWTDGVFGGNQVAGTATSIELTTAWSVMASYEHFWTPNVRTSVYGSYVDVSHNDAAKNLICVTVAGANVPWATVAGGCDPDFRTWNVGVRAQWDIVRGLYVGVDVIYLKLETAKIQGLNPVALSLAQAGGAKPGFAYVQRDQEEVVATWRIHRDVVP